MDTKICFYDKAEDALLKFAVIIARMEGKWVLCRHKDRNTWEFPGGHREEGESILETARRELYEETGATDFQIEPVGIYSVEGDYPINREFGGKTYGMLYCAQIRSLEGDLACEIEEIMRTKQLPENWTYPDIQPRLLEEAGRKGLLWD